MEAQRFRKFRTFGLFLLALGGVLGSSACAGGPRTSQPDPGMAPVAPTAELAALEALFHARQDSVRRDVSPADVAFMSGMIGHHAQALVMAAYAPGNGAGAAVRTLAARITNAQKDEIALMQRWLRDRGQPVPEVDASGHMTHDHMHMPGMLTAEQLDELSKAQGRDFDRLFLTYMIQHHQGAVTMVHELFAADGAAQDDSVFKLASDVQVDQITEVARMQKMLETLHAPSQEST